MPTYAVHFRDTRTGEVRVWLSEFASDEGADFMLTEGNYSCDCNRSIFFGLPEIPCNVDDNVIALDKLFCLGSQLGRTREVAFL